MERMNKEVLDFVNVNYSIHGNLKYIVQTPLLEQMEFTDLYTLEEVANLLDMSIVTIRQYVRLGKMRAKKEWKHWMVPSNEIARVMYERKHGKSVPFGEPMLAIIDGDIQGKRVSINEYEIITLMDLLTGVKDSTLHSLYHFIRLFIDEPNIIECVACIPGFFRQEEEDEQESKYDKDLLDVVTHYLNYSNREVIKALKNAYKMSLMLYKNNHIIRVYMDRYGEIRYSEMDKNTIEEEFDRNTYKLYEFPCLDVLQALQSKKNQHLWYLSHDYLEGSYSEYYRYLVKTGRIEAHEDHNIDDYLLDMAVELGPNVFLSTLKRENFKLYVEIKRALKAQLISKSTAVRDAWKEILRRPEFNHVSWIWD